MATHIGPLYSVEWLLKFLENASDAGFAVFFVELSENTCNLVCA